MFSGFVVACRVMRAGKEIEMPIWGEVELLCRAIWEEAKKEADRCLAQAEKEAERVLGQARDQSEKEFEAQILAQRSKAFQEAKRKVDSAELEARKRLIGFREEVIREIFSALEERLRHLRHETLYVDFLLSAAREGMEALPGRDFIVELESEDLEAAREKIDELEGELSAKIELKEVKSIEGGCRIYTGDRRLLYDNTLPARLGRQTDEFRREIWGTLFGAVSRGT